MRERRAPAPNHDARPALPKTSLDPPKRRIPSLGRLTCIDNLTEETLSRT